MGGKYITHKKMRNAYRILVDKVVEISFGKLFVDDMQLSQYSE